MKRKVIFISVLFFSFLGNKITSAQTETNDKTNIQIYKANEPSEPTGTLMSPLKINNQSIEEVDLQWDVHHPFQNLQKATETTDYTNKRILKPGEAIIFEVENSNVKEDSSLFPLLSQDIQAAIERVPEWLHYDLKFKFRIIENTTHRTKMVNLLNATPKQYLDEVAFMITYLPYEVLKDSRFTNDWEYLIKNVEMIYAFADSLKYVRLVEKGDTNTNDWKTTTEYKIKQGSTFIWREINPYYYYQFIVMPKIEQEGLYVTDNVSSTGQRTWGYGWREYLWYDPDTTYSYRPVNISGYKIVDASGNYDTITIDTIPRLGEIMQMPDYLWNESMTIYLFNRDFKATDDAMNVLGNWCSRCIPMDVTEANDYRPSQPNHIAWKHIGNCHEDALLVAAAARTCLIPLMHIGDFCDDHVWGMFHDGGDDIWHHFEFFRGGCSPGRPYYWGMTNMQEYGHYGWNSSLVQGYIPDGTLFNVSDCYSETQPSAMLDLTIVDSLGKPIDGVRVNLYSTNTQYGTTYIRSAGYLWTDAMGRILTPIGTGKKYYMKISHPKFGSFPTISDQVYVLINTNTTVGKTYNPTFVMPSNPKVRNRVEMNKEVYEADNSLKISFSAKNITTDKNPVDGQASTFYERTGGNAFLNAHILTEAEMNTFKSSGIASVTSTYTFAQKPDGTLEIPLHKTGKTFIALTNDFNYKNYVEIEYSTDIVSGAQFDVNIKEYNSDKEYPVYVYPNPASNYLIIKSLHNDVTGVQLVDIAGKTIKSVQINGNQENILDVSYLEPGMYFVNIDLKNGKIVKKFIKQ